jgi:hypothetical protein
MADKIGRLGQAIIATQGTTTAYQCPVGKGAKVQLMFRGPAGAASTFNVVVAGMTIFVSGALTAGNISFSTSVQEHNSAAPATINGSSDGTTVAPGPKIYWLAAGDTVSYTIGTADFAAMTFQVVGVEVDVT